MMRLKPRATLGKPAFAGLRLAGLDELSSRNAEGSVSGRTDPRFRRQERLSASPPKGGLRYV